MKRLEDKAIIAIQNIIEKKESVFFNFNKEDPNKILISNQQASVFYSRLFNYKVCSFDGELRNNELGIIFLDSSNSGASNIISKLNDEAKTKEKESGHHALYATFGLYLGNDFQIPLVLFPINVYIENNTVYLKGSEKDIIFNHAIFDCILKNHPPYFFKEDESLQDSIDELRRLLAVSQMPGEIVDNIYITTIRDFEYLSLRNIVENASKYIESPFIKALINRESITNPLPPYYLDKSNLKKISETQNFSVSMLDSESERAVYLARDMLVYSVDYYRGSNEYEVINSIITTSLYQKKKVLVLSNSVKQLKCLEEYVQNSFLNDSLFIALEEKLILKNLYKELVSALAKPVYKTNREFQSQIATLDQDHQYFESYLESLTSTTNQVGKSFYEVVGELVNLDSYPFIDIDFSVYQNLDYYKLINNLASIEDYLKKSELNHDSVFLGYTNDDFTPEYLDELRKMLDELISVIKACIKSFEELRIIGLNIEEFYHFRQFEECIIFFSSLTAIADVNEKLLNSPKVIEGSNAIVSAHAKYLTVKNLYNQINSTFTSDIYKLDIGEISKDFSEVSNLALSGVFSSKIRNHVKTFQDLLLKKRGLSPVKVKEYLDMLCTISITIKELDENTLLKEILQDDYQGYNSDFNELLRSAKALINVNIDINRIDKSFLNRLNSEITFRANLDNKCKDLAKELTSLMTIMKKISPIFGELSFENDTIFQLHSYFNLIILNFDSIKSYRDYLVARSIVVDTNFLTLIERLIESDVPRTSITPIILKSYLYQFVNHEFGNTLLKNFDKNRYEEIIRNYQIKEKNRNIVVKSLIREALGEVRVSVSENPLIEFINNSLKETKTFRLSTIRKRIAELKTVFQSIKPLVFATPTLYTQYLLDLDFDTLIVVDGEKSKLNHLIPALATAKQLIIFNEMSQQAQDDSISSAFKEIRLDSIALNCFYQQIDQRIVNNLDFCKSLNISTNSHYLDDKYAINIEYIDSDSESDSNISLLEANTVIDNLISYLLLSPDLVAVYALNKMQYDILHLVLKNRIERSKELAVIIKEYDKLIYNHDDLMIDNVDTVLISVGYHHALNKINIGELNLMDKISTILIRANKKVGIFSSIKYEDLDQNDESEKELADFFNRISEKEIVDNTESNDKLINHLYSRLTELGLNVIRNASNPYTLDLMILHPNKKRFVLGIESDGGVASSQIRVKDRYLIKRNLERDRDWTVHYLYSINYLRNPNDVINEITRLYYSELKKIDHIPLNNRYLLPTPDLNVKSLIYDVDNYLEYNFEYNSNLKIEDVINNIIEVEAPCTIDSIKRRLLPFYQTDRLTKEIDAKLDVLFRDYNTSSRFVIDLNKKLRFRRGKRKLEDIYSLELDVLLLSLLKKNHGLSSKMILSAVSYLIEQNLTDTNRIIIEDEIEKLMNNDLIHLSNDLYYLNN